MRNRVVQLARTPRLLIASDFDGTLAPIVSSPEQARPEAAAMKLLRRAAGLPQTAVAIVSGRSIPDLLARMGQIDGAWYVGGHGAETQGPHAAVGPCDCGQAIDVLLARLRVLVGDDDGFFIERKPTSVALHYRNADPARVGPVLAEIDRAASGAPCAKLTRGKMVVELHALQTDKGVGLARVRYAVGATGVFFAGDDTTDEDAFRRMTDLDVAVKIGSPPTDADFCVESPAEAHTLIEQLVLARESWLAEIARPKLQDYSILSDQRTIAVVSPAASVEWFCVPRIDSGSIFASLLDREDAGHWTVAPLEGGSPTQQSYRERSLVLETVWPTIRVIDYLDGSGGRSFQRAGRSDLVRIIEGIGAGGKARVVFAPRLDFGRARTRIIASDDGLIVEGAADPLVLFAPGLKWTITDVGGNQTATAICDLSTGPVLMELRSGTRSLTPVRIPEQQRRSQTERAWNQWAGSLTLPSIAPELCLRSALALRALSYGPTGAVLAAATTGLPETFGGERNWDYRYCWPRDAAVACTALVSLGNTGVAMKYLDWLLGVVDRCSSPERLRPIYSVTGDELGVEADLSNLSGYRHSRPVRIGNAAARQVQLDVFGPIVNLIYVLAEAGAAISPDHWRLVEAMAMAVERSWREPDHGIWEVRTDKHHHVHTKVMCWMAMDRAVRLANVFVGERRESWSVLRDQIRDDVLAHGYDQQLGGFVAAYDLHEPDAAALSVGLSGLLTPDDPRFRGTIRLVQDRLLVGGTVLRYRFDDGLPGPEGGFQICTGWLVEALAIIGERTAAHELFSALAKTVGATGLMTEQWCPSEQIGLGNLIQAYSHAALISSAVSLSAIEHE